MALLGCRVLPADLYCGSCAGTEPGHAGPKCFALSPKCFALSPKCFNLHLEPSTRHSKSVYPAYKTNSLHPKYFSLPVKLHPRLPSSSQTLNLEISSEFLDNVRWQALGTAEDKLRVSPLCAYAYAPTRLL
eukprot:3184361-Rhodomonas_salina.2